MDETYFVLFVLAIILVSWIFKSTRTENMTVNETCSRPIKGPEDGVEIYGPAGGSSGGGGSTGGGGTGGGGTVGGGTVGGGGGTGGGGSTGGGSGGGGGTGGGGGKSGGGTIPSGTEPKNVDKSPPLKDTPGLQPAWQEDDTGLMDSTTMTQNPMYASTFKFTPPTYKMDLAFPVEGPPQPYLTDFSRFHR